MAENLTAVSTFTEPVVMPTGGDPHTAASIKTAIQALTNRSKYNKDQFEFRMAEGVQRVQFFTSLASLRAATGMVSGDVAMLLISGIPVGVFFFSTAVVLPDNGYWLVAPTVAGGTWMNVLGPIVNLAGGADGVSARLGSGLPAPNAILTFVDTNESAPTLAIAVTGTSQDTGFISDPVTVQVGDRVKIEALVPFHVDSTNPISWRLASYDGSTTAALSNTNLTLDSPSTDAKLVAPLLGYHSITTAGTYQYKVQALGTPADTLRIPDGRRIHVTVIRPLRCGWATPLRSLVVHGSDEEADLSRRHAGQGQRAPDRLCLPRLGHARAHGDVVVRNRLARPLARRGAAGVGGALLPRWALGAHDLLPAAIVGNAALPCRARLGLGERHAAPASAARAPGASGRAPGAASPRRASTALALALG
jgi:hypothetical protein